MLGMQAEAWWSPREVGSPQIIAPLSGLRLTPVANLMSIPRRAERPSNPIRPLQPRPPTMHRIVIRANDAECSSSSSTREDCVRFRRELLRRKFEQRPSRERLVTQHILLSDGRVSPLIEQQARALRQNRIKNSLSRKLGQRPGPLELVTRKILQVDAELENAIQEGRLLFTPTKEPNQEEDVEEHPTPITADMEVVATVKQPPKSLNSLTNKGILRKPTKPNPYKPFEQSAPRSKTKTPESRLDSIEENSLRTSQIPRVDEHNNYELLLQQQQLFLQWQNETETDCLPSSETTLIDQGSSTPTSNGCVSLMRRKLSDLKVQELKNECKKRNLPVSGAKPQLLERLRGFEKDILGATPPPSPPIQKDDHSLNDNLSDKGQDSHMLSHCNGVSRQCSPPEIIFQSETSLKAPIQQKDFHHPPSLRTIQPQQMQVQGNGSQLVQLYDEKGNLLGLGTVQLQPDNQTQTVVLQQRIIPAPSSSVHQPTQLVEQHHVPVSIAPAPRVLHSAGTGHLQKQQDGTFCFAQMGSGGQFTAVPHNEMVVDSHHKLQTVQKAPVMVNTVMAPPSSAGPSRVAMTTVDKSSSLATAQPPSQTLMSSPHVVVMFQPKCQPVQEIQRPQQLTGNRLSSPKLQRSPRIADHPECSPSMPLGEGNRADSCTPIEVIKENDEKITLDPNDPSSVLTPTTLQMHEDMLRKQHKLIESLEQEVTVAQDMLRKQQQIILAAKKTQQKLRERQRYENEEADQQWVRNMDIRNLNKSHIQNFLQHKGHIQKLTNISKEHNRLKMTEERLQEELHVDQAVHDIVRLIKQDPRTALLIVQLLRKYQLERTQVDIPQPTLESTEDDEVIEMSSVENPQKVDSVQSSYSERKSSLGSETSTSRSSSVSYTERPRMMPPHLNQPMHLGNMYYSDPMNDKHCDENVDMEAIFKSVLEDANRGLPEEGTPEQNVECTVSATMESPKLAINQMQWNPMIRQTVYVPHSQMVSDHHIPEQMTVHKEHEMNPHMNQSLSQQVNHLQTELDKYGAGYPANNYPTLDEVMAVVQADTDFATEPFGGVEYGSEELAQLLGDDWLNCAERSISHDGQYVPYQDESGRRTDPMSMGMPMDTNDHHNIGMDWLDEVLHHEPVDTQLFGH